MKMTSLPVRRMVSHWYVDNGTDHTCDPDPQVLIQKITREAKLSPKWLKDNHICIVADKTKLFIAGTQQLRALKIRILSKFSIVIDNNIISERTGEKLLSLLVNNELSLKKHLYDDDNNIGLIP